MASDPVNKTWYRIAVAPRGAKAPVLLAAQGEHLGVAIGAAIKHAGDGARVLAVEVADAAQVPLGESVGKQHVVELGASAEPIGFEWPAGVVPALGHAVAGARAGFTEHHDPKLFIVEAMVPGPQVAEGFMSIIERLPSADNLEVRVLDHFEDRGKTDVWLTSRVNARKIVELLDDHDEDLIFSGQVQLSVYVRAKKATLRLTEHKTIVWIAEDRELEADVAKWFKELELPRVAQLERITSTPHFHYRGPKTRVRKALGDELYRQRLRRVDTLKTAASS